jgi:glucose-6-phosphate 1-dehydrogenase
MNDHTAAQMIPPGPFDIVVFGATGDLALRKLIPALFHRWIDHQIDDECRIFCASRDALTNEEYCERATPFIEPNSDAAKKAQWQAFSQRLVYIALNATQPGGGWETLKAQLGPDTGKTRMFYLALPPELYIPISEVIRQEGLNTPSTRLILEKPIGRDLASAERINAAVCATFPEDSIFRIDHYLGKETVQNLLILRFANGLFEPVWNSAGIDHVQITVAETLGAGKRASYYDTAGALRDMVQNHILQLLCLVAMEPPLSLSSHDVRSEKLKVINALRPITKATVERDAVRARYTKGAIEGEPVTGYEDELGHTSRTETFVAIKAHIDNWRWAGVPFYLRTGKRMSERRSEIVIQFKDVPHDVVGGGRLHPNRLIIRLQPDEGVKLMLMTKDPGPGGLRLRYVPLNLSYATTFEGGYPDAYERLLMAAVRGNLSLFMHRDEVEAAWRWVDGIISAWQAVDAPVATYPAGNDGPTQGHKLLWDDQREWFEPGE